MDGAIGYGIGNDLTNNTAYTTQYLTPENEYKLSEGWQCMPDPVDPSKTIIFDDEDSRKFYSIHYVYNQGNGDYV
ncbi:hypothetical protein Q4534_20900 [Cyclobacterium sp. 1_MG-2023]|uniref:hypothetical protein n=1 Tax=Cyclobacterium sp. 1_MG-2023 TaxID=3062681 RepID=UPI0026E39D6B|nr:hypothetical protein [Cyclobacterium sp. 1_MG-2023]MDO6439898.1 hypothetical protein [Cyclobacterium sp. 1_MG-2023]